MDSRVGERATSRGQGSGMPRRDDARWARFLVGVVFTILSLRCHAAPVVESPSVLRTDQYEGLLAETVTIDGQGGDVIHAYYARPLTPGPHPAVVLCHHFPGWDEWYKEQTRRFAYHGYLAICPDLYCRLGHGDVDDVA